MEAGRQLHQGAGSLAWEQGVAGLRGIGSSLGLLACCELRLHSQCIGQEHQNPLAAQHGQLGGRGLEVMGRVSDLHSYVENRPVIQIKEI